MAETSKSRARREREGWFTLFCPRKAVGIDIGCGDDPVHDTYRKWDYIYGDGDATLMEGVPDQGFDVVLSSHCLEHLDDPVLALQNWYRILRYDGFLIVNVPHRMLYEKRDELPSKWNHDHKHFWLPDIHEPPCTRGLRQTIKEAIPEAIIHHIKVLDEGFQSNGMNNHSSGEFSIEAVIRKYHPCPF